MNDKKLIWLKLNNLTAIQSKTRLYPIRYNWFYDPVQDHTPAIGAQNKAIVDQASVFTAPPLPSEQYKAILKGLS